MNNKLKIYQNNDKLNETLNDSRLNYWFRIWFQGERITAKLIGIFESKKYHNTPDAHAFFIFEHEGIVLQSSNSYHPHRQSVLIFNTTNAINKTDSYSFEKNCEQVQVRFKITSEFGDTYYWGIDEDDAKLQYICDESIPLDDFKKIEVILNKGTSKPKFQNLKKAV